MLGECGVCSGCDTVLRVIQSRESIINFSGCSAGLV